MGHRGLAWTLVLAVVGSWCLAALAVVAGIAPAQAPRTEPLDTGADGAVVLVGIPGLTWDHVGEATPVLRSMAQDGGSAALVLRGPDEVTCAADAWLTVGAGTRVDREALGCGFDARPLWDGQGATEPPLGRLRDSAAAAGTCVATYGLTTSPGSDGRPQLDTESAGLLSRPSLDPTCGIHLVASPAIQEGDRTDLLEDTDAALGELAAALPPASTLVISGMGQVGTRPDAQVLVVAGSGPSLLTSGSTRQAGLAQLVDLTATLLQLAGVTPPADLPGAPVAQVTGTVGADGTAQRAADLALAVSSAKWLAPWTLGLLAAICVPLLLAGAAVRRWGRARSGTLLTGSGLLVMSLPAATFAAGLAPWWLASQPWAALSALVLGAAALVVALAWWLPSAQRSALGPPAVVAAVTLVLLGVDTIWSSRLGLVGVLGLQPVTAGRFYGQGNVGFGIVLGAMLVLMSALLTWIGHRRREAGAAVALLGASVIVLGAAPQAGADFGSVPATAVSAGLVLLAALGVRWSPRSLLLVGVGAALLAALAMVLDWARGPQERTHLGAFVQSVIDGEALGIVTRKLQQSLGILVDYPLSWLAVLALVAMAVVVVRRPTWSRPLWEHRGVAPVAAAAVVGMTVAWVLNDSGIAAVALCLTVLLAAGIVLLAGGGAQRSVGPRRPS
ncbi:hypothetical protein [Serinicoccus kebangsaanensis]|uniref:hypothetical protein n=1 Tax=Serinicoccus kebangsaanensis TaxID=2602069 RepID=UPI00124F70F2|nr:hypothetical protein [Serinicoccus kebangsaanensis]